MYNTLYTNIVLYLKTQVLELIHQFSTKKNEKSHFLTTWFDQPNNFCPYQTYFFWTAETSSFIFGKKQSCISITGYTSIIDEKSEKSHFLTTWFGQPRAFPPMRLTFSEPLKPQLSHEIKFGEKGCCMYITGYFNQKKHLEKFHFFSLNCS